MEYTHLGRLGLVVSRLCLGTMNFGPHTSEPDSHAIMDSGARARHQLLRYRERLRLEAGRGATEQIIGRWFAQGGGRREKVVLATKVYGKMGDWPNEGRLSALHIRNAVRRVAEAPAHRPHRPVPDAPHRSRRLVGRDLAGDGAARPAGQGPLRRLEQLRRLAHRPRERARARNFLGLASEQSLYNLNARTIELEVLPAVQEYGMGLIPYSPLAGGLLAGALSKVDEGRRSSEYLQAEIVETRSKLERWEALCAELGERPSDVALAWLLAQPGVTSPIIGPRTVEQLNASIRALSIDLSTDVLAKPRRDLPRPGGPAPEAYAW